VFLSSPQIAIEIVEIETVASETEVQGKGKK
jgi:hypothetical protein